MSIELLPLGMECKRACSYCYQEPVRDAGNEGGDPYDMDAMKAGLEREGHKFTMFGGEPLLMPIDDLEEIFAWGKARFGESAAKHGQTANGVQTDGYLLSDAHLRIFRRYDVGVGMSIDGPGELNDARQMREGGQDATRAATAKSIAALEKMLAAGMGPSLIVTLHKINASEERLPRLLDWFRELAGKGLRNVNLHLLEVDKPGVRSDLALTEDEAVAALLGATRLQAEIPLTFQPISDMVRLLQGEDQWDQREDGGYNSGTSCIWNGCDSYTTDAVRGVDGQGNRRNCGRTYKDGVQAVKADTRGFERYVALYHAPQEYGGCAGCRFFYACKGSCPGTGDYGDWRAKTEHCGVLMRVFGALEAHLLAHGEQPFSLSDERPRLERAMISHWQAGSSAAITPIRAKMKRGESLAGEDAASESHQDIPHGDSHGDHDDHGRQLAWASV